MKSKQSRNTLIRGLKKETITHLSRQGMLTVKTGAEYMAVNKIKVTDSCRCTIGDTPVPTDFGITPFTP
jgi:hypothetical protein